MLATNHNGLNNPSIVVHSEINGQYTPKHKRSILEIHI